jgi:hypothetical protein
MPNATRSLLLCGAVAGPLYLLVATAQALTREGFDVRWHAASLLAIGELGWVQIANFVVAGALVIAGAVGMRRALPSDRVSVWWASLVGVYGVGLVAAGVFVADPANGFPVGASAPPAGSMSPSGAAHFVAGGVAFAALVAAGFVGSRSFFAAGRPGWGAASAAIAAVFLVTWMAMIGTGAVAAIANVAFAAAIALAWAWLSAVTLRLRAEAA